MVLSNMLLDASISQLSFYQKLVNSLRKVSLNRRATTSLSDSESISFGQIAAFVFLLLHESISQRSWVINLTTWLSILFLLESNTKTPSMFPLVWPQPKGFTDEARFHP